MNDSLGINNVLNNVHSVKNNVNTSISMQC